VIGAAGVALVALVALARTANGAEQSGGGVVAPSDAAIRAAQEVAGAAAAAAREAAAAQDVAARARDAEEGAAATAHDPPPERVTATRVVDAGPTEAQRASAAPLLEIPFLARADEELTAARISVALASPVSGDASAVLEVLVNDERIGLLPVSGVAERAVDVDRELLAPRNTLALRLLDADGRAVARPGAWRVLRSVQLVLETSPAALPNDLALLPLPFLDRGFDPSATVPVVLAAAADADSMRLAALVAGWLALDSPVPLSFAAHLGALPDTRAVVLVAGDAQARRLGLEPAGGPSIRMIDHPRHPGSNVKLLVVAGRDADELRAAVESLAARTERLVGEEVRLPPAPPPLPSAPYSAPRWVPTDRPVRFAEYPQGGTPAHDASRPATLSVRFRVSPDLWIWPTEFVVLDLGWEERLPAGMPAPRLDVDMNGYYLATLPAPRGTGEIERHVRLRIPREHMRGFNELRLHVRYPEGTAAGTGESPRVAITGDSVLHLEGMSHFAVLPDVALFAFDGFPFTRVPDLGETAIVVPATPVAEEVAEVLTIAAQLAQVTGRVGIRATFLSGDPSDGALAGKDVLAIGAVDRLPLLARWHSRLPLAFEPDGARVRRAPGSRATLELTSGLGGVLDRRRAERVLEAERATGAIVGIESPVTPGRAVYFVTGPAGVPPFRSFLGYAESRSLSADDVLVLAGDRRWMFRLGPSFGRGALDAWTALRWFLANHWVLLLPVLALGVIVLARLIQRAVGERMRERLLLEEEQP
jgi:hypothetical protein